MVSITEFPDQSGLILYSFSGTAHAPHGDGNSVANSMRISSHSPDAARIPYGVGPNKNDTQVFSHLCVVFCC